jgi:hypothetical protein
MMDWDEVRGDLGDKVVDALIAAVTGARSDLEHYRAMLPGFAYEQSARGLAGWIHDRMWQHLERELFDVPGVVLFERGPTREVVVGINYRLRLKRHNIEGVIQNVRTPTALAFWEADEFALPGLGETRLCFGYVWDGETDDILDPVVSHRSSQDTVLWMVRLDEEGDSGSAGGSVEPIVPPGAPDLPRIELPKNDEQQGTEPE